MQTNSDHKTQKIKLCSVRALKRYLNEKNLIHGRVMATISKLSPQVFETYFRFVQVHIRLLTGSEYFSKTGSDTFRSVLIYGKE